mgnify:CR=1 FL=1
MVDFAGYSGTKCAKMNNYANEMNRKDELISPAYDLSEMESIELSFKIALPFRSNSIAGTTISLMAYSMMDAR